MSGLQVQRSMPHPSMWIPGAWHPTHRLVSRISWVSKGRRRLNWMHMACQKQVDTHLGVRPRHWIPLDSNTSRHDVKATIFYLKYEVSVCLCLDLDLYAKTRGCYAICLFYVIPIWWSLYLSLSRIETPSAQHLCCSPAFAFVTRSDPFVHAQVLDCWTWSCHIFTQYALKSWGLL